MNLFLLCLLWIGWCALHSILIMTVITDFVNRMTPWLVRYYRLIFNGVSAATLLPLVILTHKVDGTLVFAWHGWGSVGRVMLLVAAFFLFWSGARRYDLMHFLGVKQLQSRKMHLLLNDLPDFSEDGIFGVIRHPWYLGSLLFIWSALSHYFLPVFLVVVVLSIYLVIGTILEEQKILASYGDAYRLYQQRVSMLFPWKWLKNKFK